ncbi:MULTISPECIES: glycosyltransferase family 4 protein [unclassified Lebetimonas]|uniref:glycosyltransferase family 4 protein n=1 Tax=unclassified Lebetimonas TaxID=2648158 RepID=UPI0004AEB0CB|nr:MULTISPECIES: glycosyltransferase family 4 protein [unclassified Lebetimonas]
MKLLFIISSLSSGGAERVMSILANKFVETREVVIVTMAKTDSFYPLHKNIKHIKLDLLKNSNNIFQSAMNNLYRIKAFVKIFKKENPDVIISFMTHTNILAIIASKIARKKIIISERIAYDYYGSKILNIIRRFVYPFSDAFITQTYADLKNYSFLKHSYVIYNPIETESFDTNIKKQNIVLGVGRLDKQKGFDNLIKAYSKLNTNWKLYIAGEGNERKNLEKLIKNFNLEEKVILLGKRKDIFEWYKKASIFVLSSKKEGFPNVLIEAMAFGCAVVSFDCPYGPNEIIENGVNGILVENQNIEKLAFSIQKLIDDENLRKKLSKEAMKVREKYSIERIVNKWENIIKKVVNE